jgi:hypothetical protein
MVTLEEVLGHPLFLLLVGAGVSSVLILWFTNKWQDHRKKLEIKVELVSRMSEAISYPYTTAMTLASRKKKAFTEVELDSAYENFGKWFRRINIIRSKIQSYYPDSEIITAWHAYLWILFAFYQASLDYFRLDDDDAKKELLGSLEMIKVYLSNDESIEWNNLATAYDEDMWSRVANLLTDEGDKIINAVLKLKIKVF